MDSTGVRTGYNVLAQRRVGYRGARGAAVVQIGSWTAHVYERLRYTWFQHDGGIDSRCHRVYRLWSGRPPWLVAQQNSGVKRLGVLDQVRGLTAPLFFVFPQSTQRHATDSQQDELFHTLHFLRVTLRALRLSVF